MKKTSEITWPNCSDGEILVESIIGLALVLLKRFYTLHFKAQENLVLESLNHLPMVTQQNLLYSTDVRLLIFRPQNLCHSPMCDANSL